MGKLGLVLRSVVPCIVASLLAPQMACAQARQYDQPYRPQVHFSPREHWTNDPNGLVFYKGEYHLFFQYNPFGDEWGHMSWGHAVSADLLHWRELPVALPEAGPTMIFTGSVVVDHNDTSGLCAPASECLVAVYTGHMQQPSGREGDVIQTQNLAVSGDNGRTWTNYAGNPVLDLHMADFRDPSVSWNEQQHRWLMAVSLPKQHKVRFYASANLKQWSELSDFGPAGDTAGDWECPDLLEIPSAKKGASIWALKVGLNPGAPQGGSGEQYFLGSFDGRSFTPSTDPGAHGWTNYGKDDYCAISYNGLPRGDRPVLIGWMSNWQYAAKLPTSPWRGQMSLPRRLSFTRDGAGLALQQEPISAPLRAAHTSVAANAKAGAPPMEIVAETSPFELALDFASAKQQTFGMRLYTDEQHWTEVGFDQTKAEFYVDRTHAGVDIGPGFAMRTTAPLVASRPANLRLIVDRSSVEAYAQNGTIAMTDLVFPAHASETNQVKLFVSGEGTAVSVKGDAWELQSVWK